MHREVVFEMSSGKSVFIKWINQKPEMSTDELLHEIKEYLKSVDDLFYCKELNFDGRDKGAVLINKNNIEKIFIYEC